MNKSCEGKLSFNSGSLPQARIYRKKQGRVVQFFLQIRDNTGGARGRQMGLWADVRSLGYYGRMNGCYYISLYECEEIKLPLGPLKEVLSY